MSLGATDKQRSLFLKGFKLSKQGNYEDPTYLGFKLVFDFGTLPVGHDDGLPPSPLFKIDNYLQTSFMGTGTNPFSQPQYSYRTTPNGNIAFYSAAGYLAERESNYFFNQGKRSDMMIQFRNSWNDILTNSPWFIQSIDGLNELAKVARGGYASDGTAEAINPQRTAGKTLQFTTLESLNLRMTALAELYNQATFDYDNMRELVPRNLRKFTMYIFVTEIRNFFKTSRLIGSSAALTTIDNLASLLGSGNNPGNNLGVVGGVANEQNKEFGSSSANNPGGAFNSFVGGIADQAGLDNDFSLLKNQQDQSGIKPVIVFECRNCEFDFSDSTPIQSTITAGNNSASQSMAAQKFKIHVGRVRMRSQFPNIRQDGKPLILGDSWDGARSSVQKNPRDVNDILSIGSELLTNFIGNSVNDLINEGVANYIKPAVAGLDTLALGNIYSLNPSDVLGKLSFNNAQQFFDQLGNINPGFKKTTLPNPQNTGSGGPPERVYKAPGGDVYTNVPGKDLGVPGRVYATPSGDTYPTVPGSDLGVPGRVYGAPSGDTYPDVPGKDLGVPGRVYPTPNGDVYTDVPGPDLGVPSRIYPAPSGDTYPDVPGKDLGVPGRVYPAPTGDEYTNVPGSDLGVPGRVYPSPSGDVYANVPGTDLGVPTRAYPGIKDDVYKNVPGSDLGVPARPYGTLSEDVYKSVPGNDLGVPDRKYSGVNENVYPAQNPTAPQSPGSQRVYPDNVKVASPDGLRDASNTFTQKPSPVYQPVLPDKKSKRGDIGKAYPQTTGDFIVEKPLNLGNLKPPTKYNISTGQNNTPKENFD